jgi:hypothetical protein
MVEHMNNCSYELILFILFPKTEKNYEKDCVGANEPAALVMGRVTHQYERCAVPGSQIPPIAQIYTDNISKMQYCKLL